MRGRTHHIFLIPGFFGFVNFGKLVYFYHVREFLEQTFGEAGIAAEIHRARIPPTASIRRRTAALLEYVSETVPDGVPIHLIGHSTGGLDARLFTTPGADLGSEIPLEPFASRIRSVVTVSTPHFGAPLASLFTSLLGQRALALLSLATVEILRNGRLPISIMARIGAAFAALGLPGGKAEAVLELLAEELVGRQPRDERDHLKGFIRMIREDQSLLPQLTPEGIDVFNAVTSQRRGIRYGCVVSRARRPTIFRAHFRFRARVYAHLTYELYRWIYMQSGMRASWVPTLTPEQESALRAGYGELPAPRESDGIVPALSQVWGEVIHAATADHLDVIGHFHGPDHEPPHHDWLVSGSSFRREAFESLWRDVTRFILQGL